MALWRDLLLAVRTLAKSRAFTLVCVLSLGIGMAPVIAIQYGSRIFTTPPAGLDVENLVEVFTKPAGPRRATDLWSYPDFRDLRDADTGMSMTGWVLGETAITLPGSEGEKRTRQTLFVSPNYFQTMNKSLARGPGFSDAPEPAALVGFDFWQQRLGSDPAIVGQTIGVNGVPHVVVGIGPEQFGGHQPHHDVAVFLPLDRHPVLIENAGAKFDRNRTWIRIHGRLEPGVTIEQANSAVEAVTARLAREYPATNELVAGTVGPYHPIGNLEASDLTLVLAVWQAMTLIPLIVVCLNISGMVQVRCAMRERELTIRQAIGASRKRLAQHLLAESVVLAGAGGALASLVLFNLPPLVAWFAGEPLPAAFANALRVDLSMIAICVGLCLVTSLVCGWLPAIRFSRPKIMAVLKDESGSGGIRAGRVHRVTSALQVAIAVPLLILSGVALDRVRVTATSDLGFASDLYAAPIELRQDPNADAAFQIRRVSEQLSQTSGVAAVTVSDGLPLDFRYRMTKVSSRPDPDTAPRELLAHVTRVGDNYLETLGIPLLAGRAFTRDDAAGAPMVTIVSNALAEKLFPGGSAIGQQLTFESSGEQAPPPLPLTVVGVTTDFPTSQMSTDREQLLLPLAQHPDIRKDSVQIFDDRSNKAKLMLVARAAPGEPGAKLTAALENVIREHEAAFDRTTIVTGTELRQYSMDDFINQSAIAGFAGGIALVLAALGIYGVVGLMVATRTREIAVRVTLGASRRRVIGMILFDIVRLIGPGVAAGLLITLALTRIESGVELSTAEPLAFIAGAVIALGTAVLAGLGPARRAASVQPMVAMRST